jgi:hypothetical protein
VQFFIHYVNLVSTSTFFTHLCVRLRARNCHACNYTYAYRRPLIVHLGFVPSTNKRSHSRSPRYIRSIPSFTLKASRSQNISELAKIIHNYTNLSLNLYNIFIFGLIILSLSFCTFSCLYLTKDLKFKLHVMCRVYMIIAFD